MRVNEQASIWAAIAAVSGIAIGSLLSLAVSSDAPAKSKSQPAPVLGPPAGRPASATEFLGHSVELATAIRNLQEAERRLAVAKQRYLQLMEDVR